MQHFYISEIYRLMGGDGVPVKGSPGLYKTNGEDIGIKELQGESHVWRKGLVAEAMQQYDPQQHSVTSTSKRPPKMTFVPTGEKDPITGQDKLRAQPVDPARIPLKIQKYIIKQKASFARGNGVKLKPSKADSPVYKWVYDNWYANKTDNDLRETFERLKAETQCAIIYFADDESLRKAKAAKDPKRLKLKHKIVSPEKGSYLYPYFDPDTESLVALMREYKDSSGNVRYDVYLEADPKYKRNKPVIRRFAGKDLSSFTEIELNYPKLPIVYWGDNYLEFEDSKELIEEMENSFSDFATQIGYTADPILFLKGSAISMPAKGSAGKVMEGTNDADAKYLTPDNATESRELHFKLLQKWIFSLNRSVVLDLDAMKNMTEVSGAALERLLIDAFMEATDHQTGYWGKGVQRMVNFQLAVAKYILDLPDDETTIDVEFVKYRINDIRETVEVMLLANGNKPIIDWEQSVALAGLADDPSVTFKLLQKQQEQSEQTEQTPEARLAQEEAERNPSNGKPNDSLI